MPNLSVSVVFLEDFVAARVFHLEGELAVGVGFVIGAVEREGADVDGLAGLVDGLLGGEKNGGFVLELDGLGVLGRSRWACRLM